MKNIEKYRLNYNKTAKTYAKNRIVSPTTVEMIFRHLKGIKFNYILDVGCGNGDYTNMIYEAEKTQVCGVDPSYEMIKIAEKRYPMLEFKMGKADEIPYTENYFDLVLLIHVLHHIDELYQAFKEINRVLSNKGWIVIVTYSYPQIIRRMLNHYWPSTTQIDLCRYPKIDEIIDTLRRNKINSILIEEISHTPRDVDIIRFRNRLISSLNFISDNDFNVGLKKLERDIEKSNVSGFKVKTIIWGNNNPN